MTHCRRVPAATTGEGPVPAVAETAGPSAEEVLERERRRGPRAGIASIVAGVLVLLGGIALQAIYSDVPRVLLIDALRDAAGQDIGREGLLTAKVHFYDDKAIPLILTALLQAIGALCTGYVLAYLYDAAVARHARLARVAKAVAMFGAVATAVGYLGLQIVAGKLAADFVGQADQSSAAAHDALRSGGLVAMQFVGFVGTLALALGFLLIALNAMRVGLLTRFMGILGILVGALLIIPIGSPVPIVQAFWMVALGLLLLGRWPRGTPAAWETGRAQPWATQQELREQREQARTGMPSADRATEQQQAPAASKKKRKRRR